MKRSPALPVTLLAFCCCIGMVSVSSAQSTQSVTQGTYTNIYEMLRNVPGLEVKMGSGGKAASIVIRGAGSLNLPGTPLVVVDGVIFSGDLNNINPQDVAGITVLKDAATTAAYGAQGANGVLQITLKSGTKAVAKVTQHNESPYRYFIDHKTSLRVFGMMDEILIEGPIARQQDSTLVFIKKRKEILIPIAKVKRVEMLPND